MDCEKNEKENTPPSTKPGIQTNNRGSDSRECKGQGPSTGGHRKELTGETGQIVHTSVNNVNTPNAVNRCENYLSNECNDVNTSESNLSNECNDVKSSSFNLFDDNGRTNRNPPSSKFCCWNTNADSLRNKLTELKARIDNAQTPPAIIAITEAKPKTTRFDLTQAELNIDGYDIFSTNHEGKTGRGIVVYTASYLKAYVVNLSSNLKSIFH